MSFLTLNYFFLKQCHTSLNLTSFLLHATTTTKSTVTTTTPYFPCGSITSTSARRTHSPSLPYRAKCLLWMHTTSSIRTRARDAWVSSPVYPKTNQSSKHFEDSLFIFFIPPFFSLARVQRKHRWLLLSTGPLKLLSKKILYCRISSRALLAFSVLVYYHYYYYLLCVVIIIPAALCSMVSFFFQYLSIPITLKQPQENNCYIQSCKICI